jgi:drug/metabolite transporter (DMT)-like permease
MQQVNRASRWAIGLSLGIVWIVWGSSYLAIAVAIESIPPFAMAATRFGVAGVLLLGFARLRGTAWPERRQWGAAALVGTLLLVGGNGLVTWAEQTVPSSIAALLITTVPLWMTILDGLIYGGKRPTFRTAAGLVVGFTGVGILVRPSGDELGSLPLLGSIALLVASFSWAHGSLWSRRLPLPTSPLMAVGAEMLCAGVILAAIAAARSEFSDFDPGAVTPRSLVSLAYLVVFASIAALTAYQYLLRTISASAVSTYAFVNPIVAVALGWTLASEPVTARVLVAGALIVTAVIVILGVWERPRPRPSAAHREETSVGTRIPGRGDGGERKAHAEA